jgi:hypothetical protein
MNSRDGSMPSEWLNGALVESGLSNYGSCAPQKRSFVIRLNFKTLNFIPSIIVLMPSLGVRPDGP